MRGVRAPPRCGPHNDLDPVPLAVDPTAVNPKQKKSEYSSADNGQSGSGERGGFIAPMSTGRPMNAARIKTNTGLEVGHLERYAHHDQLNHAARQKGNRIPPSREVLEIYHEHAAQAHEHRMMGKKEHGSGVRLRSEIRIGQRAYTLIERIGERAGRLSLVTMWENVAPVDE